MPDILAKAAEAVREWLEGLCDQCTDVENCEFCRLDSLKYETRPLEAVARAVLEAAGYEEAIALVEELRQWVYSDCASIVLYGPEDCQHCAYRKACKLPGLAERIQAALARAGKEVA